MTDYRAMFMASVETIAQISDALGIPEEDAATANGADLILGKIELLRLGSNTSTCACGSSLCDGDHENMESRQSPEQRFWSGK
jgi:hypothetical protein